MRLIEILLSLVCAILLLSMCFRKINSRRTAIILAAVSYLLLAMHFILEGYRWQMFIVYAFTILLTLISLLRSYKKGLFGKRRTGKIRNLLRYSLYSIMAVLLILSVSLSLLLPVFNLPVPEGPYATGTEMFHFVDTARDEILTDLEGDKRELIVQIWYPASVNAQAKSEPVFQQSDGMFEKIKQAFSHELGGFPAFLIDYWKYIKTNSYRDAEISTAEQSWPVVILSHGMGTTRTIHTSQAESLASHGFIVAAIDHTYSTTITTFPDGRTTDFRTEVNNDNLYEVSSRVGMIWMQDVGFVVNQLEKMNAGDMESLFISKLDLSNIGAMGHSFGGSTALNSLCLNEKIKAAIDMDGTLFTVDGNYDFEKPFLLITSQGYLERADLFRKTAVTDEDLETNKLTRELYNIYKPMLVSENETLQKLLENKGKLILMDNAAHYNYTDLQLYTSLLKYIGLTGSTNGRQFAGTINQYVLDFFDEHLRSN